MYNWGENNGSELRRAKEALKEKHSPKLQFLPDNDANDYTMAIVMINEEFAAIREEEQKSSDVTKEITKEIKKLMKKSGEITRSGATKAGEWEVIE